MSTSAGRVLLLPKGDYNASTTYSPLDYVRYNHNTYVCKQSTTGNLPTNTTYWQLLAEGIEGPQGPEGPQIDFKNAGFHNSFYRGKSLGTEVTAEQYAAISAGTFDDMFIGDYWTINGTVYRIAHFDYWLNCGDTACTTHHVVVVPDTNLYSAKMNDSNVTTGGYIGSQMYTNNLANAKTTIQTAFGNGHILTHREYFVNAVTNGKPSAGSWYNSAIDLMNERMVYGNPVFEPGNDGSTVPTLYTIDKSQLALFALDPSRICNYYYWWLRDVVSGWNFASVERRGYADHGNASYARGVRPAFGIKAA